MIWIGCTLISVHRVHISFFKVKNSCFNVLVKPRGRKLFPYLKQTQRQKNITNELVLRPVHNAREYLLLYYIFKGSHIITLT